MASDTVTMRNATNATIVLAARSFMEWWREEYPAVVEPDCPELRRLFALLDHSKRMGMTKRNIVRADVERDLAAKARLDELDAQADARLQQHEKQWHYPSADESKRCE